jgi:hypothetical protein
MDILIAEALNNITNSYLRRDQKKLLIGWYQKEYQETGYLRKALVNPNHLQVTMMKKKEESLTEGQSLLFLKVQVK